METWSSTSGPLTHGVLLLGDPGCRKTVITQALAKRCEAAFYSLSPAQFNQKFAGESEKFLEAVFRNAVQHESIFVFIDEVDNVCESATATIVHTSNLKSTLLTELTRVAAERLRIFIGATNYPEKIDENFLRRFHQRIWIRPPNQKKKGDILTLYLRKCHYNLSEGAIALLSNFRELEDCSGDDIRVMVETAATLPLKELVQNDHASWKRVPRYWIPVDNVDPAEPDAFIKRTGEFTQDEKKVVGGLETSTDMVSRAVLGHKAKTRGRGAGRRSFYRFGRELLPGIYGLNEFRVEDGDIFVGKRSSGVLG